MLWHLLLLLAVLPLRGECFCGSDAQAIARASLPTSPHASAGATKGAFQGRGRSNEPASDGTWLWASGSRSRSSTSGESGRALSRAGKFPSLWFPCHGSHWSAARPEHGAAPLGQSPALGHGHRLA